MAPQPQTNPHSQSHEWHNGLMTCSPIGDCCLGLWCPCILYGRTLHRERDPSLADYEKTNDDCKRMGQLQCWTSCGFIYVKRHRTELREKYGIPGSTSNDFWATFCCLPCAQIQMDKEVELREAHRVDKEGYRKQEGMAMQPRGENATATTAAAPAVAQPMVAQPDVGAPASQPVPAGV